MEDRELTYGEKLVGVNFNPSQDPFVNETKVRYAMIIDGLAELRSRTNDPETKRLASVAITEAQTAQMWAVKAYTWSK